jgi:pilus assembly protein Flp/PilA
MKRQIFIGPIYLVESRRRHFSPWARQHPQEPPMRKLVFCFVNDDTGATAIEYGLIAAGISIAIIAVVNGLGTQLTSVFSSVSSQLGGSSS